MPQNRGNVPRLSPWWESLGLCAESSPRGCTYSIVTQLECVEDVGDDGAPVKRCIQMRKLLTKCPGMEPTIDEQRQETTTYPDAQEPRGVPFPRAEGFDAAPTAPEPSDVGQALEEVIRLAEDIQEGILPPGASAVQLDTPPPAAQRPATPTPPAHELEAGLLSRLLKGRRWRQAEGYPAAGAAGFSGRDPPWRDFANDFQDV